MARLVNQPRQGLAEGSDSVDNRPKRTTTKPMQSTTVPSTSSVAHNARPHGSRRSIASTTGEKTAMQNIETKNRSRTVPIEASAKARATIARRSGWSESRVETSSLRRTGCRVASARGHSSRLARSRGSTRAPPTWSRTQWRHGRAGSISATSSSLLSFGVRRGERMRSAVRARRGSDVMSRSGSG